MSLVSRRAVVCALLFASLCPAAAQDDCARLGLRVDQLENGSIFFYTEQGWYPFASFRDVKLANVKRVSFAYVVKTNEGERDRTGVLVVKSAIFPRPQGRSLTPVEERVELVRREGVADLGCAPALPYEGSSVSAKGYEDYHELEATETTELRSGMELQNIKRFHVEYVGEAGCIRTDDFHVRGDVFSNASQFSFKTKTVDRGPPTGLSFNAFGEAYADPPSLVARRTEIKRYQTTAHIACTVFDLPINGDERNILRVNDLEGRDVLPARRRKPEFRAEDRG